jgi:hypothetical protein
MIDGAMIATKSRTGHYGREQSHRLEIGAAQLLAGRPAGGHGRQQHRIDQLQDEPVEDLGDGIGPRVEADRPDIENAGQEKLRREIIGHVEDHHPGRMAARAEDVAIMRSRRR